MPRARPGPGEELVTGEVSEPRLSASVLLLRGGEATLEVLLVRRTPAARFMGGVWVFPGGAVDAQDGEGEAADRAAAVRELREEAGVVGVDPADLVPYSRWITPEGVRIRFDTRFFLAAAPEGAEPRIDGAEIVDACWFTPRDALAAFDAGQVKLVFPTLKHLDQIAKFPSAAALLRAARGREVQPVQPRIVGTGEQARIVLPGEAGYED